MIDFDEREIKAIEEIFPDSETYICDFHREQAWERWLSVSKHGVSGLKDDVLLHLRSIANASSEEEVQLAKQTLQTQDYHPNITNWLERQWYPHQERSIKAYRSNLFNVVNTINGLECQHKEFKYGYLAEFSDHTLMGLIRCLVERFCPTQYDKYR